MHLLHNLTSIVNHDTSTLAAPPEEVKELKVVESDSTSITLEFTPPPLTGRSDVEYEVCYDIDFFFHSQICDPRFSLDPTDSKTVYVIKGLISFTTYFIKVTTYSGVSELDDDTSENIVTGKTTEGGLFLT